MRTRDELYLWLVVTMAVLFCFTFWTLINVGVFQAILSEPLSRAARFVYGFLVLVASTQSIISKLDFDESEATSVASNSSTSNDDDVEVKHTIVVSTKLRNNNRRGLHSNGDAEAGTLTYNVGHAANKGDDSGEVPIVYGLKSVDTTQIRTPDTRFKPKVYPDSVFINRNIRDHDDHYPNAANNPMQWKPSSFFNNINWWNQDNGNQVYRARSDLPDSRGTAKFHRKITDDGMKEFYCRKCREYNGLGAKACVPQRRNAWVYETTTPKMKLDGKLAKLN